MSASGRKQTFGTPSRPDLAECPLTTQRKRLLQFSAGQGQDRDRDRGQDRGQDRGRGQDLDRGRGQDLDRGRGQGLDRDRARGHAVLVAFRDQGRGRPRSYRSPTRVAARRLTELPRTSLLFSLSIPSSLVVLVPGLEPCGSIRPAFYNRERPLLAESGAFRIANPAGRHRANAPALRCRSRSLDRSGTCSQ